MSYLPPPPRLMPPEVKRGLGWNRVLIAGAGVFTSVMLGVVLSAPSHRDPEDALMRVVMVVIGALGVTGLIVYRIRRSRHWSHGVEVMAEVTQSPRGVQFPTPHGPIAVETIPYETGAATGRGPILYDPTNPDRILAVRLCMLPPEKIEEMRTDHATLPPRPRARNREWEKGVDYASAPVAMLIGLIWCGVFALGAFQAPRDGKPVVLALAAPGAALVVFGGLSAWRSRAVRRTLWRDGVETRGIVRSHGQTYLNYEVRCGDVVGRGGRGRGSTWWWWWIRWMRSGWKWCCGGKSALDAPTSRVSSLYDPRSRASARVPNAWGSRGRGRLRRPRPMENVDP